MKPYVILLLVTKYRIILRSQKTSCCIAFLLRPHACCAQLNANTYYPFLSLEHSLPEQSRQVPPQGWDGSREQTSSAGNGPILLAYSVLAGPAWCRSFLSWQARGSVDGAKLLPQPNVPLQPVGGGSWRHDGAQALSNLPLHHKRVVCSRPLCITACSSNCLTFYPCAWPPITNSRCPKLMLCCQ